MGNCVFRGRGLREVEKLIKVVTSNGGIMQLHAPITAEYITNEFPGQGIFLSHGLFSQPLLHSEELVPGEVYYLLPLNTGGSHRKRALLIPYRNTNTTPTCESSSSPSSSSSTSVVTPYRMSFDSQRILKRSESEHMSEGRGVWKVKLVISREQLEEILSQEARTEALIESVRTVAKCGNGAAQSASKYDQWSISTTWIASFDRHGLLDF